MSELSSTTADVRSQTRLGGVLGLTSTAYFMVVINAVVVITALPRMQRDLKVSLSSLQWTLNAYGIAFAAGIITAAALGDRFGRRRIFNLGLALFTIASAACALAPDASELIAARTVQGLGGAIVLPLSLTILTTAFPPERRAMIIGVYGGLAGLAVAAGPLIGGGITEGIDWHWIFWINVPIGVVALALCFRLLPESYGAPGRLDPAGVALVTGGVVALVWALVCANQSGWASAEIVSTLAAGTLLLLLFVAWESWHTEPMVPLRLFRNQTFAFGNATTFLMSGAISPAPTSSRRSSSSPAATRRCRQDCGCFPSSRRRCSSGYRRRDRRQGRVAARDGPRPCPASCRLDLVCLRGGLGTSWVELTSLSWLPESASRWRFRPCRRPFSVPSNPTRWVKPPGSTT